MTTLTVQNISSVLYSLDPMNTCCVENGIVGEYDYEASQIFLGISNGEDLREVLVKTFDFSFWGGCLKSARADKILQKLTELV